MELEQHMKNRVSVILCVCLCFAYLAFARTKTDSAAKEIRVTGHATGTFEVKLVPQPATEEEAKATLGRMSIDKQFHGDLEGTSKGVMLSSGTAQSSGAYVALEKVSGTLKGRNGTFVLQHTGIMTRGTPQLTISVVPDSGTGELTGIAGKMDIKISDGKHFYEFDYTLPEKSN